jgi:hypothetical protein
MVQLVRVDRRRVLPFSVEKAIPLLCILEVVRVLPTTWTPFNVDTTVVETERVETLMLERVTVLP